MRPSLWRLVVLVVALITPKAIADGKVFPVAYGKVSIPDQEALIAWDGKTETLAIETRFEGAGEEFAWVVPLPAAPEVRAATPGLFPTLRAMFAPEVKTHRSEFWIPLSIIAFCALAATLAARGFGKYFLCCGISFVVAAGLFLPSLGKARGGSTISGVSVLSHELVGSFDVTTIAGENAAQLAAWLRERGYQVQPEAEPVIADYAKRGWVFVASRLRREMTGTGKAAAHPLIFTFPADKPIYPMTLTGVGATGPLSLALYVFGPGRAASEGLEMDRCGRVAVADESSRGDYTAEMDVRVSHAALRPLVLGTACATKLIGTLEPAAMTKDIEIDFGRIAEYRRAYYAPSQAWSRAADIGLATLSIMWLATAIFGAMRRTEHRQRLRAAAVGLALAAIVAGAVRASTPVGNADVISGRPSRIAFELYNRIYDESYERYSTGEPVTYQWAIEAARRLAPQAAAANPGLPPLREGDAPGCYRLEHTDSSIDMVWIDLNGQEQRFTAIVLREGFSEPGEALPSDTPE